jgi:type III secretory pathway component EscU
MSGDKTEMLTSKELRDARKQGQVFKSTDVIFASLPIGLYAYMGVGRSNCRKAIGNMLIFLEIICGKIWEWPIPTSLREFSSK